MIHQKTSIRQQQLNKLIQKELANLFLTESHILTNHIITITAVYISKDLSHAKVYVSCALDEDPQKTMHHIMQQKHHIRHLLGKKLAHKIQRIPNLHFYKDQSIAQMEHTLRLMDQLEGL